MKVEIIDPVFKQMLYDPAYSGLMKWLIQDLIVPKPPNSNFTYMTKPDRRITFT